MKRRESCCKEQKMLKNRCSDVVTFEVKGSNFFGEVETSEVFCKKFPVRGLKSYYLEVKVTRVVT